MGFISDYFSIFNSRWKSYLIIISIVEIFLYYSVFIFVKNGYSYKYVAFIHFFAKVTNTWRKIILVALMIELKELFFL